MKVALLTDSDVFAGTERHLLELGLAYRQQGRPVTYICPHGILAERVKAAGFDVISLPVRKGLGGWTEISLLYGLFRRGRFDVIHAHNGRTSFLTALAQALAHRGTFVVTQHFISPSHVGVGGWRGVLRRRIHHWVNRRTSSIIAISKAVADALVQRSPNSSGKVVQVWNGISDPLDAINREANASKAVSDAHGFRLLCVARLEREKGIFALVEAMEMLDHHPSSLICSIVGGGSLEEALRGRIASKGMTKKIRVLGFREDVLDLMARADAVVHPAPAEPFGLSIVEAMALGKPVIAMSSGGPLEIVEQGRSGLLAPPGDAGALARIIMRVAEDANLRRDLGAGARERYLKHFTAARMAKSTWAVYDKVWAEKVSRRCRARH